MSTLPIRPDLGQLKRQARELLRAAAANDPSAVGRIGSVTGTVTLAGAQLALAREHGFASWPALKAAVDDIRGTGVVPLLVGKHTHESISTPSGFLAWAGSQGWEPGELPVGMIFTAERYVTDWLEGQPERYRVSEELTPTNGRVFLTVDDPLVAIACLGIGASAVVAQVEHLVALGVGNSSPSARHRRSPKGSVPVNASSWTGRCAMTASRSTTLRPSATHTRMVALPRRWSRPPKDAACSRSEGRPGRFRPHTGRRRRNSRHTEPKACS